MKYVDGFVLVVPKKKLKEYIQAGAELPILIFPPKSSRDMVKETIRELAPGS